MNKLALTTALLLSATQAQAVTCTNPILNRTGLVAEFSGNFNPPDHKFSVVDGFAYPPGYNPPNGLAYLPTLVGHEQWIDHTPWHGDFGNVGGNYSGTFAIVPYQVAGKWTYVLQITAQLTGGKWHAGILSTIDTNGVGFYTRGGGGEVLEMTAKFPAGAGGWPAFWANGYKPAPAPSGHELDVVEGYTAWVANIHGGDHCWSCSPVTSNGIGTNSGVRTDPVDVSWDFHNYAVEILPNGTEDFYFDNACTGELVPTNPADSLKPMGLLVDLAVGGANGDTSGLPNPAHMFISKVMAWHR